MGDIPRRFPALRLERADPQAQRLRPELGPDSPLYAFAAWMYHHAHELSERDRRSLFVALERAWPRTKARPKKLRGTRLVVSLLKDAGIPTRRIASKLNRSVPSVDNLNREMRLFREEGALTRRTPQLELADPDDAALPYDPGTWVGEQFARGADALTGSFAYELEQADELAREEGFSSLDALIQKTPESSARDGAPQPRGRARRRRRS